MRKRLTIISVVAVIIISLTTLVACVKYDPDLPTYDMNMIDLSTGENADGSPIIPSNVPDEYKHLYDRYLVAMPDKTVSTVHGNSEYLGHPDNVLLDDGTLLCAFPLGHGKGETQIMASKDGGRTWVANYTSPLPETFKDTQETPTIYKLNFADGTQRLLMASGRPGWNKLGKGQGVDVSLSWSTGADGKCDGKVWQPHKNYWSEHAEEGYYAKNDKWKPIVAFASLTQLYENGKPIDKWMGIFHDYGFNVYKTFLTFEDAEKKEMTWTTPVRVVDDKYRKTEKSLQFCEPEVVRSPDGKELAMLLRTNAKKSWSHVIFSTDEGATWSKPQPLSRELTGERHKAEYDPVTGKLIITYRAINWKIGQELKKTAWFSHGLVMWVGDYEDLHAGEDGKGDFTVKLAHTYLDKQTEPQESANGDTGYCGLTVDIDGNVVVTSYGMFSPRGTTNGEKTYIIAKCFTVNELSTYFNKPLSPANKPVWLDNLYK